MNDLAIGSPRKKRDIVQAVSLFYVQNISASQSGFNHLLEKKT
ncbi:hypothetical protein [Lysinibacillus sp. FSL W8-0953]